MFLVEIWGNGRLRKYFTYQNREDAIMCANLFNKLVAGERAIVSW